METDQGCLRDDANGSKRRVLDNYGTGVKGCQCIDDSRQRVVVSAGWRNRLHDLPDQEPRRRTVSLKHIAANQLRRFWRRLHLYCYLLLLHIRQRDRPLKNMSQTLL